MNENPITGVGIMSGSSMDGLDIAIATFIYQEENNEWDFLLHKAATIPFPKEMEETLMAAPIMSTEDLFNAHAEFGSWIGRKAHNFIQNTKPKPQFIALHGHTIFHNPSKGFSIQLGNGEELYSKTNLPVITDFRSLDISLGGQGAPLVPVFDFLLMRDYDACLNLGGISNITFNRGDRPLAGDICGTNQLLNYLSKRKGLKFDEGGKLALKGEFDQELYDELVNNPFLGLAFPKSLSNELIKETDIEILKRYKGSIENALNTVCRFIGIEISKILKKYLTSPGPVLTSGGGAFNDTLVNEISSNSPEYQFIIPDDNLINFKEAIAFAFLGALRMNNEINCFGSVTGASRDSICGRMIGN